MAYSKHGTTVLEIKYAIHVHQLTGIISAERTTVRTDLSAFSYAFKRLSELSFLDSEELIKE